MDKHRARIGIDFISALGMPPLAFVELAADLGCRHISLALEPIIADSNAYPMWSLRNDAVMRTALIGALRDRDVSISLGEGFIARPQQDIREASNDLDLMCALGVTRVNLVSIDSDRDRGFDQCATFAEMAEARGLDATLEFMPGLPIGDLESAVATIRHVGKSNFRLLIDAMHFFRSKSDIAHLATLEPNLIGYAQLCDVPLISKHASYGDEARSARLPPGDGELPLLDFLRALPSELIVGLEVPMLAQAQAGTGAHERLGRCVEAAYDLMQQAAIWQDRASKGPCDARRRPWLTANR